MVITPTMIITQHGVWEKEQYSEGQQWESITQILFIALKVSRWAASGSMPHLAVPLLPLLIKQINVPAASWRC